MHQRQRRRLSGDGPPPKSLRIGPPGAPYGAAQSLQRGVEGMRAKIRLLRSRPRISPVRKPFHSASVGCSFDMLRV